MISSYSPRYGPYISESYYSHCKCIGVINGSIKELRKSLETSSDD